MKIFSWMKSKLHGKDNTIKPEPESMSYHMSDHLCGEEYSGCPNTLLAIGTFGNNLKNSEKSHIEECSSSTQNSPEQCKQHEDNFSIEEILESLPDDDEITEEMMNDALENKNVILQRATSTVHTKGEDNSPADNRKKGMYRKSLSFLLKKAFLCGGGFVPSPIINPILKDPFPDPKMDNSRMEKILRAMVRKKKCTQTQKYLDMPKNDDEEQGGTSNAKNWNKTDSEYIVLEL